MKQIEGLEGSGDGMKVFTNPEFGEIRVAMIDENENPWFVAKDVCNILEISKPSQSTRYLDDDEKGVFTRHTPGGTQEMTIVNESGLYSLILRSRKPAAKKFKKWVTGEILPSIRKTGSYSMTQNQPPVDFYSIMRMNMEMMNASLDKLENMDKRLEKIEELQEAKVNLVEALPEVKEVSNRGKIRQIVAAYAKKVAMKHSYVWGMLYKEYFYRYGVNIKTRAKNSGASSIIEYADKNGMIDSLLAVAVEVFA